MSSETEQRLSEVRARLSAATPGPWAWGPDWDTLRWRGVDEFEDTDKYADLYLRGANQSEIIPIRIDHHAPIWDTGDPREEPCKADRELIAHAPGDLQFLLDLVRDLKG